MGLAEGVPARSVGGGGGTWMAVLGLQLLRSCGAEGIWGPALQWFVEWEFDSTVSRGDSSLGSVVLGGLGEAMDGSVSRRGKLGWQLGQRRRASKA